MATVTHRQRLPNAATLLGTEEVLRHRLRPHSPGLEAAVYQAVRRRIRHYAEGTDALSRQLRFLDGSQTVHT